LRSPFLGIKLAADPEFHLSVELEGRFLAPVFGLERRPVTGKEGSEASRSRYFN
jgi:hypothetical protein